MKLKKVYAEIQPGLGLNVPGNARVTHVEVIHTGLSAEQNFSEKLVVQGTNEGWMELDGNRLTIKGQPEDLRYTVKRTPGYYSAATGDRIPLSDLAMASRNPVATRAMKEANAWLLDHGQEEGAYEVTNAYECVLDDDQHEKFHGVRDGAGNPVAANTLEGI